MKLKIKPKRTEEEVIMEVDEPAEVIEDAICEEAREYGVDYDEEAEETEEPVKKEKPCRNLVLPLSDVDNEETFGIRVYGRKTCASEWHILRGADIHQFGSAIFEYGAVRHSHANALTKDDSFLVPIGNSFIELTPWSGERPPYAGIIRARLNKPKIIFSAAQLPNFKIPAKLPEPVAKPFKMPTKQVKKIRFAK